MAATKPDLLSQQPAAPVSHERQTQATLLQVAKPKPGSLEDNIRRGVSGFIAELIGNTVAGVDNFVYSDDHLTEVEFHPEALKILEVRRAKENAEDSMERIKRIAAQRGLEIIQVAPDQQNKMVLLKPATYNELQQSITDFMNGPNPVLELLLTNIPAVNSRLMEKVVAFIKQYPTLTTRLNGQDGRLKVIISKQSPKAPGSGSPRRQLTPPPLPGRSR